MCLLPFIDNTNLNIYFKKGEQSWVVILKENIMFVFWNKRNAQWLYTKWYYWSVVGDFLQEINSVLYKKNLLVARCKSLGNKKLSEIDKENYIQISRNYITDTLTPTYILQCTQIYWHFYFLRNKQPIQRCKVPR